MSGSLVQRLMIDEPQTWLLKLVDTYKISVVEDGERISLKYDQIDSPMAEPIVQECRGLVVNRAKRKVVAWPYTKFWNHGEQLAAAIDWRTARVQEKLDGSLMILYFDDGWCVASSGTPNAGGSFGQHAGTFGDAFRRAWSDLGYPAFDRFDPNVTYMFEFCGRKNRIVVDYPTERIVLHGARRLDSGTEVLRADLEALAHRLHIEIVREFPISTLDECMRAAAALDPTAQEGFVVVDAQCNRVKIKSAQYVALHHLRGEFSERRIIELWQKGETSELLAHFPDLLARAEGVSDRLEWAVDAALQVTLRNAHLPRPAFAGQVKDLPYAAACFRCFAFAQKGKCFRETIKGAMRAQTLASLERMLEAVTPLMNGGAP